MVGYGRCVVYNPQHSLLAQDREVMKDATPICRSTVKWRCWITLASRWREIVGSLSEVNVNINVLRYEPIPTNKDAAEAFDEAVAAWVEAQ